MLNECLDELDHKCVNEVGEFVEINPTTENIARHIYEKLGTMLPENVVVYKVKAWETPGCGVEYIGGK